MWWMLPTTLSGGEKANREQLFGTFSMNDIPTKVSFLMKSTQTVALWTVLVSIWHEFLYALWPLLTPVFWWGGGFDLANLLAPPVISALLLAWYWFSVVLWPVGLLSCDSLVEWSLAEPRLLFPPSSKTKISKFQFDLESEGHTFVSWKIVKCHPRWTKSICFSF